MDNFWRLLASDGIESQHDRLYDDEEDYLQKAGSGRARTDVPFLVLHGICVVALIFFLGYCTSNGDINRILHHSDTPKTDQYLDSNEYLISVSSSDDYYNQNKHDPGSFDDIVKAISRSSGQITGLCFLALVFAFVMFLILRYLVAVFVWLVLAGIVFACIALAVFFWSLTDQSDAALPGAIVFSIVAFIVLLVIIFMRNRIQLVIQLFKEAGKAITAIPLLLVEPLLTLVSLAFIWSSWIWISMWVLSSGIGVETNGITIYKQNAVMKFTFWFNIFIMLWMVQFVNGCQNMLIAGAISRWYFTRNKTMLHKPICNSARNLIKFHLGTISVGSLIITLIQILRTLCRGMHKLLRPCRCCLYLCCLHDKAETCCTYLEDLMKYLTRNAYIVTSIHGLSFCESGERAFKLLTSNILRVFAINSVGDFVLLLSKMLVVAATVGSGYAILKTDNKAAPLVVVGIVAYLIAHCFITVYEMAIDTIFICFCEDCEINDGISRPYYMSKGLMEFVQNSKRILKITIAEEINQEIQ